MAIKTIDPNLGAGKFLIGELDPNKSSEHETLVASAGDLKDGTMMAKFTGGGNVGQVVKFDPAGINGQAVAYGLLYGAKANVAATQRVVVVVRDVVVNGNLIDYAAAATAPQKAAAEASLKAAQVVISR